jgi:hypothetical protein
VAFGFPGSLVVHLGKSEYTFDGVFSSIVVEIDGDKGFTVIFGDGFPIDELVHFLFTTAFVITRKIVETEMYSLQERCFSSVVFCAEEGDSLLVLKMDRILLVERFEVLESD